jgi:hypothetical protein
MRYRYGVCPCHCFQYKHDSMWWGCVCCFVQVGPCFVPRFFLHLLCCCVPCGCVAEETVHILCCCNPDQAKDDPFYPRVNDVHNHREIDSIPSAVFRLDGCFRLVVFCF